MFAEHNSFPLLPGAPTEMRLAVFMKLWVYRGNLSAWRLENLRNSFLCFEFKAFIRAVRDESTGVVITLNKLLSVGLAQLCLSDPTISSIIHLKRRLQYASAQFKAYIFLGGLRSRQSLEFVSTLKLIDSPGSRSVKLLTSWLQIHRVLAPQKEKKNTRSYKNTIGV